MYTLKPFWRGGGGLYKWIGSLKHWLMLAEEADMTLSNNMMAHTSVLYGHQAHKWYTAIHAAKTLTHIQ